ncbi:unnamed protein product [Ilex paraguariensis]|uniref:Uncharacterized protein n=1 Tax=Ilex paraguariensis TaxID=185542 RepID=A0ABC8SBJ2_9AQUA
MAASLAVLVFHPSSTIRCFKPKPCSSSPERENPPTSKPPHPLEEKKSSKSRKKLDFHTYFSLSRTSCHSNANMLSPPLPPKMKINMLSNVVTSLVEGEPSIGIVETMFRSGWSNGVGHTVEKVLKVNHNEAMLNRFEEYRKLVKSNAKDSTGWQRVERVVADGNELLRFHGAVITCSLGFDGISSICNSKACGVCRVLGSSVLAKGLPTIAFSSNSWKAHEKVTTRCFANRFSSRKAIVICRVIAGRVAHYGKRGIKEEEQGGFDSVVVSIEEELMVFNTSAILPCFVVIYSIPSSP